MDKTSALKILIQHSFTLTDIAKEKLLANLDTMSEEEMDNLGKYLAHEKNDSLKQATKGIPYLEQKEKEINELINDIEKDLAELEDENKVTQ